MAEKKFTNAKNTQESIQGIASWAIQHKAEHSQVVEVWLSVLKKSKAPRRLTLFYICNEIVQTCKRKRALSYKEAFQEVLLEATSLVRDASVRGNIERIFKVWKERSIFDSDFVDELLATISSTTSADSSSRYAVGEAVTASPVSAVDVPVSTTAVAVVNQSQSSTATTPAATPISVDDFKPSLLRELISHVAQFEKDVEMKRRRLNVNSIDELSQKLLKQSKDRSHSKLYAQQVEDIHKNLEEFLLSMEKERSDRQQMISMLETSELFYDMQYGEAKIVANAYKNFGNRVSNLRKRLEDVKKTLPDPLSPVPSPTLDAPSPGDSPADPTVDNVDEVDMEICDENDQAYEPEDCSVGDSTPILRTESQPATRVVESNSVLANPLVNASVPCSSSLPTDSLLPFAGSAAGVDAASAAKLSASEVLSILSSLKPPSSSKPVQIDRPFDVKSPQDDKRPVLINSSEGQPFKQAHDESNYNEMRLSPLVAPATSANSASSGIKNDGEWHLPKYKHASEVFETDASKDGNIPFLTAAPSRTFADEGYERSRKAGEPVALERNIGSADMTKLKEILNNSARTSESLYGKPNSSIYFASSLTAARGELMDHESDNEGGSTPVQDEIPDQGEVSSAFASSAKVNSESRLDTAVAAAPRVTDPIAMLNQLLSQSKPNPEKATSNVLQQLSQFTKTIQAGKASSVDDDDDGDDDDRVYLGGYLDNESLPCLAADSGNTELGVVPQTPVASLQLPLASIPPSVNVLSQLLPPRGNQLSQTPSNHLPAPPLPPAFHISTGRPSTLSPGQGQSLGADLTTAPILPPPPPPPPLQMVKRLDEGHSLDWMAAAADHPRTTGLPPVNNRFDMRGGASDVIGNIDSPGRYPASASAMTVSPGRELTNSIVRSGGNGREFIEHNDHERMPYSRLPSMGCGDEDDYAGPELGSNVSNGPMNAFAARFHDPDAFLRETMPLGKRTGFPSGPRGRESMTGPLRMDFNPARGPPVDVMQMPMSGNSHPAEHGRPFVRPRDVSNQRFDRPWPGGPEPRQGPPGPAPAFRPEPPGHEPRFPSRVSRLPPPSAFASGRSPRQMRFPARDFFDP